MQDDQSTSEHHSSVSILGYPFSFTYHDVVVPFSFLLRILMGWILVWAGFDKAIGGFTAEGFLLHVTSGPIAGWFRELGADATALSVIDPLVTYGQILMGLAIFFGVATRTALFFAAIMMFLFYLAQFPPEHDLFVDYYLVYIVVYALLGAIGAGRILGLDRLLERLGPVRERNWLSYMLG